MSALFSELVMRADTGRGVMIPPLDTFFVSLLFLVVLFVFVKLIEADVERCFTKYEGEKKFYLRIYKPSVEWTEEALQECDVREEEQP